MTSIEQLESWVAGKSIHNIERDECCPDFSCCCSEINTPIEDRKLFLEATLIKDHSVIDAMLMGFLNNAIGFMTNKKVYIAGQQDIIEMANKN